MEFFLDLKAQHNSHYSLNPFEKENKYIDKFIKYTLRASVTFISP